MNEIKILLDECISRKIVAPLQELADKDSHRQIIFSSVFDKGWNGLPDSEWIPKATNEGWIIISTDWGVKHRGVSLRTQCQRNGLTHVIMAKSLLHDDQFEKACAIIEVREILFKLPEVQKGSGYYLGGSPGKYYLQSEAKRRGRRTRRI